jgi:hypothetical protein
LIHVKRAISYLLFLVAVEDVVVEHHPHHLVEEDVEPHHLQHLAEEDMVAVQLLDQLDTPVVAVDQSLSVAVVVAVPVKNVEEEVADAEVVVELHSAVVAEVVVDMPKVVDVDANAVT